MALIPFFDLTRQVRDLALPLQSALHRVTTRGDFILGPEVDRFEKSFSRFCKVSHGVGVASGTDALELALRVLGIGAGDFVATVSFTFLSTVSVIREVGAQPLFVDIDPASYTMDPGHLEEQLRHLPSAHRRRVKAILPVHLYGHPCDMDALDRIARAEGIPIVEDCAQAHGARWKGKPVGGFGRLGCFSFYPTKNLGAHGDGGMVVTKSAALSTRLRRLRLQGRANKDRQVIEGLNSRLDELQAAILNVKLPFLPGWVRQRRLLAGVYHEQLRGIPSLIRPSAGQGATHAWCLYVIRSPRRDELRKFLGRQGIFAQIYYPIPVHRQPLYRRHYAKVSLPETDRASRQVLALPIFPELRADEVRRICLQIRRFFS